MRVSLGSILSDIKKRSIRRRRAVSFVTVLSLLIASGVVWELRSVGITMVNDVGCGIEEHVHSDSCYSHEFICGEEEVSDSDGTDGGHVHGVECFSEELACGYEEHVHSIECYDDEEEYLLLNRLFDDEDDIPVFEINQDYADDDVSVSEDSDNDDEFQDDSEYDDEYLEAMIAAQAEFDDENSEYEDFGESPFMMARASAAADLSYEDDAFYFIKENTTPDTIEKIIEYNDLCILSTDVERKFCIMTNADINHSFFATDNDGVIAVKNISRTSYKETGKNEIVASVTPLKPGTATLCFDKSTVPGVYDIEKMKIKVKPIYKTIYIVDDSGNEIKNTSTKQSRYQMSIGDTVRVCIYMEDDPQDKSFSCFEATYTTNGSVTGVSVVKDVVRTNYETNVTRIEKQYKVSEVNEFLIDYDGDIGSFYISVHKPEDVTVIKLSDLQQADINPVSVYTQQNPYQIAVGESFTLTGTTVASADYYFYCSFETDKTETVTLNYKNSLDSSYTTGRRIEAKFTAVQTGLTKVCFGDKSFWVNVRSNSESSSKIYVVTALGEREIDRINEAFTTDPTVTKDGYFMNSEQFPYMISANETVELCFYSPSSFKDTYFWYNGDPGENFKFLTNTISISGNQKRNFTEIKGLKDGTYKILHEKPEGGNAVFWLKVVEIEGNLRDHADIEITDGGFYEFRNEREDTLPGIKEITIERYDTHIVGVNHCYLYGTGGVLVQNYEPENYQANGTVGSTQYELTSKYKNNGKKYHKYDVKSAKFDVSMTLIPSTRTVTKVRTDGTVISSEVTNISGNPSVEIPSAIFNLNQRSVIDAFNKCPDHSGLDFNVSACLNSVVSNVKFKASKGYIDVSNNSVNDFRGTYTFELLDNKGEVIGTAQNDSDGNIEFPDVFLSAGSYDYTIREKPASDFKINDKYYQQGSASSPKGVYYDPNSVTYSVHVENNNGIVKSTYKKDGVAIENFNGAFVNKVIDEEYTSLTVNKVWSDDGVKDHTYGYVNYSIYRKKTGSNGNGTLVSIGGKTVFTLNKNNSWTQTHTGLPLKLGGTETYEYEVVETNIPDGYSPGYSYDTSDRTNYKCTITNSSGDHSYINILKEWKDVDGNVISDFSNFGISDVNVTLKRKSAKLVPVDIILKYDDITGGFTAVEKENTIYVYEGSNFSFKLNPEEMLNSGMYTPSANRVQLSPAYAGSSINTDGNTINVKNIKSDQKIIINFHHVWSWNMEGVPPNPSGNGFAAAEYAWWSTKGDAVVFRNASQTKHSGNGALKVVNRTENWHAARVKVDYNRMKKGKTYHVSAYMLYVNTFNNDDDKGINGEQYGSALTPTSIKFVLHFLNNQAYTQIKSIDVTGRANEWIKIDGDFTIPENADANFSYFVFQTDETNNINSKLCVSYFIDDVVITEGYVNADVSTDKKISFSLEYKPKLIENQSVTFIDDNSFSKSVSLSKSSDWRAQFDTSTLDETAGYSYRYYVKEDRLPGYKEPDYQLDNVASNTAENPIKVINQKAVDYVLPATGGSGPEKIQRTGLILIFFAAAGFILRRRIKRRSG